MTFIVKVLQRSDDGGENTTFPWPHIFSKYTGCNVHRMQVEVTSDVFVLPKYQLLAVREWEELTVKPLF